MQKDKLLARLLTGLGMILSLGTSGAAVYKVLANWGTETQIQETATPEPSSVPVQNEDVAPIMSLAPSPTPKSSANPTSMPVASIKPIVNASPAASKFPTASPISGSKFEDADDDEEELEVEDHQEVESEEEDEVEDHKQN